MISERTLVISLYKMAASTRQSLTQCSQICRYGLHRKYLLKRSHTNNQRTFFQRFSNILASSSPGSVITRDSKVDEAVAKVLENEHKGRSGITSYRNHPGLMRHSKFQLPTRLLKAMQIVFEKYPMKEVSSKTEKLLNYLQSRHPPLGKNDLAKKTREIENKILEKDRDRISTLTGAELEAELGKHKKEVLSRLRKQVYHWKPMQYDAFTSYIYLMGRMSSDFAVLLQCFTEISKRNPDFKPTSVYNHGSKVGAGIWAADKVWKTIGEYYCVDESGHMNTIAQLLLQGGNEQDRVSCISGVHFRQFDPSPKENKFSMVVSAYMLMEQLSESERQDLVLGLWEMAETYLVLVENGTGAGFSLINEAKEFLLNLTGGDDSHPLSGHVFAPCPHDKSCPKLRVKNQPCLTECVSRQLEHTATKLVEKNKSNARYSYVILKKEARVKDSEWPRVLHPIRAKRHIHCHVCLPCGEMQHVVITKGKFEKHLYNCAKQVQQGDCLPVSLSCQPLVNSGESIDLSQEDDSEEEEDNQVYNKD